MSYSILYNKLFVKVSENLYIPMILCGDNNVYESNRKRARSWYNHSYFTERSIWASSETILGNIDRIRQERIEADNRNNEESDKYQDKRFGWHEGVAIYGKHTTGTTFGMYRNFYKTGIERALTIEQLLEKRVSLHMKLYFWKSEDITSKGKEIKPEVTFTSTEHLIDTVNEWMEYYGEMSDRITLFYYDDWSIEEITKSQNKKRTKSKKEWVESKSFFALKSDVGYFIKNIKHGYRYSYNPVGGKKFMTEKEAETFRKRMKNGEQFKVEPCENHYTVSVQVGS